MLDATDPVDAIEAVYRDLNDPRPAVEAGLRWLRDHRPTDRPNTLVHGDFRIGNLLVAGTGIRGGVLDWELAHLGNPVEDLGWLCVRAWRFGAPAPVAGIGTREQLLDGYEKATGTRPPSVAELHWWEAFGTLRWLVLSRFQAERHFGGAEPSLELAAIGRRVCESEYDLLDVLGVLDDSVPTPPTTPPGPTVHGRPTVTEIVDLVADTLATDIGPTLEARTIGSGICCGSASTCCAPRDANSTPGTASTPFSVTPSVRSGAFPRPSSPLGCAWERWTIRTTGCVGRSRSRCWPVCVWPLPGT